MVLVAQTSRHATLACRLHLARLVSLTALAAAARAEPRTLQQAAHLWLETKRKACKRSQHHEEEARVGRGRGEEAL